MEDDETFSTLEHMQFHMLLVGNQAFQDHERRLDDLTTRLISMEQYQFATWIRNLNTAYCEQLGGIFARLRYVETQIPGPDEYDTLPDRVAILERANNLGKEIEETKEYCHHEADCGCVIEVCVNWHQQEISIPKIIKPCTKHNK